MFIEVLTIVVSVFGVLMSLAHFPQAAKILKTKSAADVSLVTYVLFAVGSAVWLLYGFVIQEIPIILGYILGVFGATLVVALILRYR